MGSRRTDARSRRAAPLALTAAVTLHAGLFTGWMLHRRPPPLLEPVVEVRLFPAFTQAAERPRAPTSTMEEAVSREPPKAARRSPRLASPTGPSPSAMETPSAAAPDGASVTLDPGLTPQARGALAARLGCREPQTAAERERCAERIAAAPEMRMAETRPYFRVREQVAIMAEVRRRENTAYRQSCEAMRNLTPFCPNFLPDNLPKDFELPKD